MNSNRSRGTQTSVNESNRPISTITQQDKETQHGTSIGSYNRKQEKSISKQRTFRDILRDIITDKEAAMEWCFQNNLLAKSRNCPHCYCCMILTKKSTGSDGLRWRCQKKDHTREISIRKGSWLESSN